MKEENKSLGYVALYRSLMDWEWYQDGNTTRVFIHCLLKANHQPKKWRAITVETGTFISSRGAIAAELGLSDKEVRTALRHLSETGEVTSKSTNKYTIYKVENWDLYQGKGQQEAGKGPAKGRQRATNNNDNNDNNENNKRDNNDNNDNNETIPHKSPRKPQDISPAAELGRVVSEYTPNPDLRSKLIKFMESRKRRNRPVDPEAMNMLLENLSGLAKDDAGKIAIVDQTLMNGWNGFFPLSGNRDPEPKSVPDWYGDTGENNEMDPALLEKALRIQRDLQEENEEIWKNSNEMQGGDE